MITMEARQHQVFQNLTADSSRSHYEDARFRDLLSNGIATQTIV